MNKNGTEETLGGTDAKLTAILALMMRSQAETLFANNKASQIGFLAECGLSYDEIALILGMKKNNVRVGRQTFNKMKKK